MKRFYTGVLSLILLAVPVAAAAALAPAAADGAKKEGEVLLYGAIPAQASTPMRDLFEKNYGIRINNWRGGPDDLIKRLTESKSGENLFDVVVGNEIVMAALEKKGMLDSFEPPAAQRFPRRLMHPERRMTPWRAIAFGINFNTQRLAAEQTPRKWEDLLDPKWKKKFLLPNPALHLPTLQFFLNLEKLLGPKWLNVVQGWAKQRPRLTRDPGEEIPTLTSGEIPLGVGYIKDKFQFAGPIDYVRMDKYLASLSFVAVARKAPHPAAARLFTDFFLGPEPQQMLANLGDYVLHPEIEDRFRSEVTDDQIVPMRAPSPAEREAWNKKFREMFK
jgi:iron(III) transport system substrate-binding protein